MRLFHFFLITLISLLIVSCQQEKTQLVTEKIQYDVNIKSPDPDYDWWIQNLPGPQRENLVNLIMDGALSGKFKAYDYFNNPITPQDIAIILSDTVLLTLMDKEPPYAEYDTMFVNRILREDIEKIRFLEEWQINPDNLSVSKKLFGIAPVARTVDFMGNQRWQPLFWIYTDEEFVKNLKAGE